MYNYNPVETYSQLGSAVGRSLVSFAKIYKKNRDESTAQNAVDSYLKSNDFKVFDNLDERTRQLAFKKIHDKYAVESYVPLSPERKKQLWEGFQSGKLDIPSLSGKETKAIGSMLSAKKAQDNQITPERKKALQEEFKDGTINAATLNKADVDFLNLLRGVNKIMDGLPGNVAKGVAELKRIEDEKGVDSKEFVKAISSASPKVINTFSNWKTLEARHKKTNSFSLAPMPGSIYYMKKYGNGRVEKTNIVNPENLSKAVKEIESDPVKAAKNVSKMQATLKTEIAGLKAVEQSLSQNGVIDESGKIADEKYLKSSVVQKYFALKAKVAEDTKKTEIARESAIDAFNFHPQLGGVFQALNQSHLTAGKAAELVKNTLDKTDPHLRAHYAKVFNLWFKWTYGTTFGQSLKENENAD